ncbi:kinase-like domain-containing protein [Clohesyomyces aquaticus]|uniref:mitogen-activated protein kinase kinase n=1 Tax=Clohesyomyces aquaticus TaxID=1231657 RepID=A0A1Y1ZB05_9PLEO|nr:kinase-like domain-containing protein [Clohesyomyces aquaticus]
MAHAQHQLTQLQIKEGDDLEVEDVAVLPLEFVSNLGVGASGFVEEVKDTITSKTYARKSFKALTFNVHKAKEMLHHEVKIIRQLPRHRHVIRVFATYISGRQLAALLHPVADEGNLAELLSVIRDLGQSDNAYHRKERDIVWRGFGCLAKCLDFLHQNRVRHRDIKPSNILGH